jgi:anti-anti-sigma factor
MFARPAAAAPCTHLRVSGPLDAEGALALRPSLENLVSGATGDVVLDMAGVSYMDGSGVGAVAFLFKRLAAQGRRVTVAGAGAQPLALLRKLGLDGVLGLPIAARRPRFGFAAALGFARAA